MSFISVVYLSGVDPLLGKIDKHSLSQGTLIELFLEGVTNREMVCDSADGSSDILEYKYLEFDDDNDITHMHWNFLPLEGSVSLQWMPLSVLYVAINNNELVGTVDLTRLPNCLDSLFLSSNRFEGTVDLTKLPEKMQTLDLSVNNFTGITDFTQLPESLRCLNVSKTQLEGEIVEFDGMLAVIYSKVNDKRSQYKMR